MAKEEVPPNRKLEDLVLTDEMIATLEGMCLGQVNSTDSMYITKHLFQRLLKNIRYMKIALTKMREQYKKGDYVKMAELIMMIEGLDK